MAVVKVINDPSGRFRPGAELTGGHIDALIQAEIDDPANQLPLCFAVSWDGRLVVRFPGGMLRLDDGLFRWPSGRQSCSWQEGIPPRCSVCGFTLYPVGMRNDGVCWKCKKKGEKNV